MPSSVEQFPIVAARSYAGGVIQALSIADAFEHHDDRRADRALQDALDGLEAATAQVRMAQKRASAARRAARSRPQPVLRAAVVVAGIALPWLTFGGLPS
ncbi:hypothetical protein D3C71_231090 [compost metagenome]